MVPFRIDNGGAAASPADQQKTTVFHQLEDLEDELKKLQLEKHNQRKIMSCHGNDIDRWKEKDDKVSRALDARVQNLANELRQTRKLHEQVKQEWDEMIKKTGKSRGRKQSSIVCSPHHNARRQGGLLTTKPNVEQQARDGTCTRLHEAKHQPTNNSAPFVSSTSASKESRQPPSSPRNHSSSLGSFLQKIQEKPAMSFFHQSVTTQATLFSTVTFTQFLMGLEIESCFDSHFHSESQSRRRKPKRRVS